MCFVSFPALLGCRLGANKGPPRAVFGNADESGGALATHPERDAPPTEPLQGENWSQSGNRGGPFD